MFQRGRQIGGILLICLQFLLRCNGARIFDREKNIGNNFVNVIIKKEFREVRVAFKGILVMETVAFQNSSYEMHFRQITNGHDLIQLVLQNGILKDCEYSNDPKEILEFVVEFSKSDDVFEPKTTEEGNAFHLYQTGDTSNGSHALNHFKRRKELRNLKSFVKIKSAAKQCNRLVKDSLKTEDEYNTFQYIRLTNNSPKKERKRNGKGNSKNKGLINVTEGGKRNIDESSTIEHHRRKRSPINRFLMFPGTKWCGRGQTATHYDDVGEDKEADVCCRDHDCCPDLIPSFSTRYNLFNYRFHAILHCECDNK